MGISSILGKGFKYWAKQSADIVKYGTTRSVAESSCVVDETLKEFKYFMYKNPGKSPLNDSVFVRQLDSVRESKDLEQFVPFRRLSKKPCKLSDNKYFIEKFEKENGSELPQLWDNMSDLQKADYIVKNRYEKLVSNKVMNGIKSKPAEHAYVLTTDGKFVYHETLNSSLHCQYHGSTREKIIIHNHPKQFMPAEGYYLNTDMPTVNSIPHPFSNTDVVNAISRGVKKSYVVDVLGYKYSFIPKYNSEKHGPIDTYTNDLSEYFQNLLDKAFNGRPVKQAFKQFYTNQARALNSDGHKYNILNLF